MFNEILERLEVNAAGDAGILLLLNKLQRARFIQGSIKTVNHYYTKILLRLANFHTIDPQFFGEQTELRSIVTTEEPYANQALL